MLKDKRLFGKRVIEQSITSGKMFVRVHGGGVGWL